MYAFIIYSLLQYSEGIIPSFYENFIDHLEITGDFEESLVFARDVSYNSWFYLIMLKTMQWLED